MLVLLFAFCCLSRAQLQEPEWPPEFVWAMPPFLSLTYSFSQQAYEVFINTLSPATWKSVGVSGSLLYDCKTGTRATVYNPLANTFSQCQFAPSKTMPSCEKNMFPMVWTEVKFYGRTKLSTGISVLVWNVAINKEKWPALNLRGYEDYKFYVESFNSNPQLREPIGVATEDMRVWFFDWNPNSNKTITVPPKGCYAVEKLKF